MKVSELIAELQKFSPDMLVVTGCPGDEIGYDEIRSVLMIKLRLSSESNLAEFQRDDAIGTESVFIDW